MVYFAPMREAIDQQAVEGQKRLITSVFASFASSVVDAQRMRLADDVALIKQAANADVLNAIVGKSDFNKMFTAAVEGALATRFREEDGEIRRVWVGSAVVVALDQNGKIVGYFSNLLNMNQADRGFGEQGYQDPSGDVLAKALCALHLYKDSGAASLDFKRLQVLKNLGLKPGEDIFMGTTSALINGKALTFAAGACLAQESYVSYTLAGAKPARNTKAGIFEQVMCTLVADNLRFPQMQMSEVRVPAIVSAERLSN